MANTKIKQLKEKITSTLIYPTTVGAAILDLNTNSDFAEFKNTIITNNSDILLNLEKLKLLIESDGSSEEMLSILDDLIPKYNKVVNDINEIKDDIDNIDDLKDRLTDTINFLDSFKSLLNESKNGLNHSITIGNTKFDGSEDVYIPIYDGELK